MEPASGRRASSMTSHRLPLVAGFLALLTPLQYLVPSVNGAEIRWGLFRFNLGAQVSAEYTDNENLSESNPQPDFTLEAGPTLNGGLRLAPTVVWLERPVLEVSANYGIKYSLKNDTWDETFSSPINVTLSIPVNLYGWNMILADNFTFSNEPLETTFAVNREKVTDFQNDASVSIGRTSGRLGITFAATRSDKWTQDDPDLEDTTYNFSITPAYYFRDNYSLFWRTAYSISELADPTQRDSTGYSSEIGLNGQLTPSLSGSISMGLSHTTLEGEVFPGDPNDPFGGVFDRRVGGKDNIDGISSTIALNYTHPLRPNTSFGLSFARSPGVTTLLKDADITESTSVTLSIAHRLSRTITLAPTISWTRLEEISSNPDAQKVDFIQITMGLTRQFTRKLNGGINYTYQTRDSNQFDQSYDVNKVTVSLNYSF